MNPSLPFVIRLVLRCLPLGHRREEVESDVAELFDLRRRERGRLYAYLRLGRDLASVLTARRSPRRPVARAGVLASWLVDLRYGLRLFRKHPAVIGATAGGLALAIGVGTTVFTIMHASVLRPYGIDDPPSVVRVRMAFAAGVASEWPYHAFVSLREAARQSQVAASLHEGVRVSASAGESGSRIDPVLLVSGNYLSMLGGRAIAGRPLLPSDDEPGAAPVAAVNYQFWRSRLGGERSLIGSTIWLSGSPVTLVGVLEPSFTGPMDTVPAFWIPFASYAAIYKDRPLDRTSTTPVSVIARVAHGVSRAAAAGELSAIGVAVPSVPVPVDASGAAPVVGVRLDGASSPLDGADPAEALVIVGFVLLVVGLVIGLACANVANLLLAGAAARTREISVRLALGATRGRILRQLLSESVLIGVMAGGAGLVLSLWLVPIVASVVGLPETFDVRPDLAVVIFTAVSAVISGAAAGLAPARHGARNDLISVLKTQGRHAGLTPKVTRTRRVFIGFQAAASILLLVTAALFLRAALSLGRVDLGFDADRLVTVSPAFPRSGFDAPAVDGYWRTALERVRALPFVEQAALALSPPFGIGTWTREVPRLSRSGQRYRIYENRTDAAYFAAAGFRLLRGRGYTEAEVIANAPVAVVSESVVRDFFAETEPIGASLALVSKDFSGVTVIGVLREALTTRVRGLGNGGIYRPMAPGERGEARLVVRASQPAAIVRQLETALAGVDSRVRVTQAVMSEDVEKYLKEPKVLAGLSGAVAGLALVLAVLGVYGVTAFVVRQRMWEMHVRQAIGASAADIVRLLVRQSLTPVVIGLAVGLAVALAAVRALTPVLSGVSPYDPAAIGGAVIILLGAATFAVLSPALRAARADPAAMLRES